MSRAVMKSLIVKRSVIIDGHKTSMSLEDEFWQGLKTIAAGRHMPIAGLVDAKDPVGAELDRQAEQVAEAGQNEQREGERRGYRGLPERRCLHGESAKAAA